MASAHTCDFSFSALFLFNSYAIAADTMDDKYIKGETLGVGTFASVVKATVKEVS